MKQKHLTTSLFYTFIAMNVEFIYLDNIMAIAACMLHALILKYCPGTNVSSGSLDKNGGHVGNVGHDFAVSGGSRSR